jgi:hypothetical protein
VNAVEVVTVTSTLVALNPRRSRLTLPLVVATVTTVMSKVLGAAFEMVNVPSMAAPEVKSRVTVAPLDSPCAVRVIVMVVVPAWL